jgi:hypothetical protein
MDTRTGYTVIGEAVMMSRIAFAAMDFDMPSHPSALRSIGVSPTPPSSSVMSPQAAACTGQAVASQPCRQGGHACPRGHR